MLRLTLLATAAVLASGSMAIAAAHLPGGTMAIHGPHGVPVLFSSEPDQAIPVQPNYTLPKKHLAGNLSPEPYATYISYDGYAVCGAGTCGERIRIAAGFTPAAATRVSGIDIGLIAASIGGFPLTADVALYSDSGGVPGKRIDGQDVTAAETKPTTCCLTTHAKLKSKPKLKAGTQYWVVVTPDDTSYLVWAFEDSDFVHPAWFATDGGSGWTSATGAWEVPSFQVE
jgi:hypothetical protein